MGYKIGVTGFDDTFKASGFLFKGYPVGSSF